MKPPAQMSLDELSELEECPSDWIVEQLTINIGSAGTDAWRRVLASGLSNGAAVMASNAANAAAITGETHEQVRASIIELFGCSASGQDDAKAAALLFDIAAQLLLALDLWPWEPQGSTREWA